MNKRIGVLLSGRGSNFEALADSVAAGRIPNAEIAIVLSNREGAPGIEKARARGIAAQVIPSKGLEREAYDKLVVAALQRKECGSGLPRGLHAAAFAVFCRGFSESHPEYSSIACCPRFRASNRSARHWNTARNSPAARCISWTKISMPGRSCCRPAFRSKIATRRKRSPSESCVKSTAFTPKP